MFGFRKNKEQAEIKAMKKLKIVKEKETRGSKLNGFEISDNIRKGADASDLAVVCLPNFADRVEKVNLEINNLLGTKNVNYVIMIDTIKFSNGDGKVRLTETVRGKDVYVISDVSNYSITYRMYGFENHMSPDEHFQDIIRTISAIAGKARKITLIMPLLYSSRQHRRQARESLDCAMALRQLENLGIDTLLTYDAHDPNIQNVTPTSSFDSIFPLFPVLEKFILDNKQNINQDKMVVISPDNGATERTVEYASMLKLNMGMFYKRRDYTKIINGKNPIIAHEYSGPSVENKDALIIDDMIASGESLLDVAKELKKRGAKNILAICTFAFFTEGLEKFDYAVKENLISKIYCTNASFVSDEMKKREWLNIVEMEEFTALLITALHSGKSFGPLINSNEKIKELLQKI